MILHGGVQSSLRPETVRDNRCGYEVHKGRVQTERQTAHAGSRLKPLIIQEGSAWKSQPSSRTGENSPYGMIGGSRKRRHHSKPDPRLDPTRLPLADSGDRLAALLFLCGRLEFQRDPIHAVALPGRPRPIVEDVAEMPAAAAAMHLGAWNHKAVVVRGSDRVVHRREEARPPGAAVEFCFRLKQR